MLTDVFHQCPDHHQADQKTDGTANEKNDDLALPGNIALEQVLYGLQAAGTEHGGNGQKKGKFSTGRSADTQQQGT